MTNGDILEFYYGGSRQGYIRSEASGNMRISADDNIDFRCDGSVRARVVSAGIMPAGDQTHDLGRKGSPSDRVWRNIYGGTFYGGSGAKKGETQVCRGYVSGIRRDGDELQARYTELEFIGGIFSRYGDESGWFKVADF